MGACNGKSDPSVSTEPHAQQTPVADDPGKQYVEESVSNIEDELEVVCNNDVTNSMIVMSIGWCV